MKQLISNKRHFEIAAHTRTFPLFFHKKNKQTYISISVLLFVLQLLNVWLTVTLKLPYLFLHQGRPPVHHRANTEKQATIHTHIHTYGQLICLSTVGGKNPRRKRGCLQTPPRKTQACRYTRQCGCRRWLPFCEPGLVLLEVSSCLKGVFPLHCHQDRAYLLVFSH